MQSCGGKVPAAILRYSVDREIRDQKLADVAAIGGAIGAGTNCGSCRPALARILTEETSNAA